MLNTLVVGDTIEFLTAVDDYPPADGWTFKIRIVHRTNSAITPITLTATTSGTEYLTQVAPSTTANWTAGDYSWTSWVEKSGARYVVESGLVELLPNPAAVTTSDLRTHARIVLDAIEAVIEGRASKDQEEYTIGARSLKRTPIKELLALRDRYKAEVRREDGGSSKLVVRL